MVIIRAANVSLILTASDGTRWRVTVSPTGALTTTPL